MIGYTSIITTAVGGMASRFITMRIYKNDYEGASYYFNTVLVANGILSIIFTLISIVCVVYLPYIITIPENLVFEIKILFAFACASMIVGLASSILGTGTFVKNRVDVTASRTVITNLVRVAMILLLFAIFKPSIIYMSLSAFVASLLGVYYNMRFKKIFLNEIPISPLKYFKLSYLKELVGSSIWNSVNQLSFLLLTQLDLIITNIFIGVTETGDYSIAKLMPSLVQSFIVVLVGAFIPYFTILYAKEKHEELIREINKSVKLLGIASSIPIGFLIVYGSSFFKLWIGEQYSDMINTLSVLSLIPLVFSCSINTIFHVYTITNKLKVPSIVLLINGIINTLLVFVLLKFTKLGVLTIPIASMCTLIIKNITFTPMYAAFCLGQKLYIFHKNLLLGCSSCLCVMLISCVCRYFVASDTWISFITSGALVSTISLFLCLFIFLSKQERVYIINIVKKRWRNYGSKANFVRF